MLEAAATIPSLWASVHGWLTPTVLFVLLNVVIGTIAVTSKSTRGTHKSSDPTTTTPNLLCRSPSLVLQRIRSFNLHNYYSAPPVSDSPFQAQTFPEPESLIHLQPEPEPVPVETARASLTQNQEPVAVEDTHPGRTQSDTKPAAGEMPEKLAKKLKKSATINSAFKHFEFEGEEEEQGNQEEEKDAEIPRRPATMRERERARDHQEEGGGEVDARADDFINRFRQQLKLQRLDSIIRYKEMLKRGN